MAHVSTLLYKEDVYYWYSVKCNLTFLNSDHVKSNRIMFTVYCLLFLITKFYFNFDIVNII